MKMSSPRWGPCLVVFVMMWLRRRCTVRLHSHMVEDIAARARLFSIAAVQAEQWEFFTRS